MPVILFIPIFIVLFLGGSCGIHYMGRKERRFQHQAGFENHTAGGRNPDPGN